MNTFHRLMMPSSRLSFRTRQGWNATRRYSSSSKSMPLRDIVALSKNRGFIYPGSEIYGGFANSFEYGPLGVLLKENLKKRWWRDFVTKRSACVGLESSILMSPKVWQASGHVESFVDPMVECSNCHSRMRADHMLEATLEENGLDASIVSSMSLTTLTENMKSQGILDKCNVCGTSNSLSDPRQFNLLFETRVGPVQTDNSHVAYFRPETAQGAYVNFGLIQKFKRGVPLGIAQIGKSFRNEVSPGNFIFRTREFDQAELQWFCAPSEADHWYDYWVKECHNWLLEGCGLQEENVRLRHHDQEELAHYAKATVDLEFRYPFGWGELWGVANRGEYDLTAHSEASGKKLVADALQSTGGKVPWAIEPSLGMNRLILALLCDAFRTEVLDNGSERKVLRFLPEVAPYQVAVASIVKNNHDLNAIRDEVFSSVCEWGNAQLDESSTSAGKKYRRSDEIGTPYFVMVDSDAISSNTVTVRGRDSMRQKRVDISLFKSPEVLVHLQDIL